MTDQNILLQEGGYPNAPDIKTRLRDPEMESHESQPYVVWTLVDDCLLDDAANRIEQLERELAEARKDAARYQWLRDKANNVGFTAPMCWHTTPDGTPFDAAIGGDLDDAVDLAKDRQ